MGKIEKTIFILDYLSNEELRRKILSVVIPHFPSESPILLFFFD